MKTARLLGLYLLPALGAVLASSAAGVSTPYSYDVTVSVPDCPPTEQPPEIEIFFKFASLSDGFKMTPHLRTGAAGGSSVCLPSTPYNVVLPNDGSFWRDAFSLNEDGLFPKGEAKGTPGVGWRVKFVDWTSGQVRTAVPEATFEPLDVSTRVGDDKSTRFRGAFRPERFLFHVEGYRAQSVRWEKDPSRNRPTTYMLVVEVERALRDGTVENLKTDGGVTRTDIVDPPPVRTSEPVPEPARTEPKKLQSLEFQLVPRERSRWWPETVFWFRDAEAEDWRQVRIGSSQHRIEEDVSFSLPEDLVGRELEVQATVVDPDGPIALVFPIDSEDVPRVNVRGLGQERKRLTVTYPKPPQPMLEVRVVDPGGSPRPRAWVAVDFYRGKEIIETSGAEADDRGIARLPVDLAYRDRILVFCFGSGGFGSRALGLDSPLHVDCQLEGLTSRPIKDGKPAPLLSVRTIDQATGRPVPDARVEVEWKGQKPPVAAVPHGPGYWVLPTPNPVPTRAEVSAEAPCYGPITQAFEDSFEGVLRLQKQCLTAKLSLRLVEAGSGAPVRGADQAKVVVRQGSEPGREVRFQGDGYSHPAEIDFDPEAGPVLVEVDLAGFARIEHEIGKFEQRVNRSTGYTEDIEIPLTRSGRGLAILINAAENWSAFPQARRALIQALREAGLGTSYDRLVVGTIGSQLRLLQAGDSPALVDTGDPDALNEALSWLGGASASGGLFHASQLTPDRLRALDRVWISAGSWDLVLVVPHQGAMEVWETSQDLTGLRAHMRKGNVRLFVVEDGGGDQHLQELAGDLEGTHYTVESGVKSDERMKKLKKYVSKILRDRETGGDS